MAMKENQPVSYRLRNTDGSGAKQRKERRPVVKYGKQRRDGKRNVFGGCPFVG
ncbi:MAG: hypothetical protein NNA18_09075 [Nitrospira sp.]|nr:hypothetical protein [Nitrospira sp.]